jgi:hypothetical protein
MIIITITNLDNPALDSINANELLTPKDGITLFNNFLSSSVTPVIKAFF